MWQRAVIRFDLIVSSLFFERVGNMKIDIYSLQSSGVYSQPLLTLGGHLRLLWVMRGSF